MWTSVCDWNFQKKKSGVRGAVDDLVYAHTKLVLIYVGCLHTQAIGVTAINVCIKGPLEPVPVVQIILT